MTREGEQAAQHIIEKLDGLAARIKELEAENRGLERIIGKQARSIGVMSKDVERIDRLEVIRDHGAVGAWSRALLALHHIDDSVSLRAAIDAAVVPPTVEIKERS